MSFKRAFVVLVVFGIVGVSGVASFGQVTTWGGNSSGQLGRTPPLSNFSPAPVVGLGATGGIGASVAAGSTHSVGLKTDGTVVAWGSNTNGELGDGTNITRLVPTAVNGATGLGAVSVKAIAAGANHTLALDNNGAVWAWGRNDNGQLGDGSIISKSSPVMIISSGVTAIAAGGNFSMALKSDGTVLAWGLNDSNQLGDGTTNQSTTPVMVSGLDSTSGVVAIAAGNTFGFARKGDGTVLAWGDNSAGQLGDNSTTQRSTPVPVFSFGTGSGVISISAGFNHAIALKSDGTVWSWGDNSSGQLGDGTLNQQTVPIHVSDPSGVGFLAGASAIAAGGTATGSFSVAVEANGSVFAWGFNDSGQLGDGTPTTRNLPVAVGSMSSASGIAAGDSHSIVLKTDNSVSAWGANTFGQLGRGTFDGSPAPIPNLNNVTMVATNSTGSHNLALKSDQTVVAWGANSSGQLGDGSISQQTTPVAVSGLTNVIAIAAGASHSLAVKSDGSVWSWGLNTSGQLGIGNTTTTSRSTAGTVPNLGSGSGIIAVAAGAKFSMALSSDGAVWTWGLNGNGQLGDGTLTFKSAPVQVIAPVLPPSTNAKVVAIAAGGAFSLALKSDGTLLAWGANSNGQLGDGTTTQKLTPTVVPISNVIAIAAGNLHSLAVQQPNGTLLTWGMNSNSQLGDGGTTRRTSPFAIGTGFLNVAGGAIHSLALKADHTVWSWGNNSSGQLGDGTLENRNVPVSSLIAGATAISGGNTHSIAIALAGPSDATAPVITPTVTGTLGENGWYLSNVTVTWTITDPESSIISSSVTGCSTTNITTETAGTLLTCSATNSAGLTASQSVTIKVDKTPPDASFTRTAANAAGWNKSAVNVHFTATDNLSGLAGPGVVDQNITTEGQNQSASATFTDLAGNTVTISIGGINIDLTPPTVQFAAPSPAPNAAGWNNTDVQMGFTVTDNLSGLVSPSSPGTLTFTAQGSNLTSTLTVTDAAGNSATFTSPAVKIDKTAPVATATASPAPDANGWNSTDVTVTFSGTDNLSGIASCSAPVVLSTNGANQSSTPGTCTDFAGNVSAPVSASGINIIKPQPPTPTGPVISGMPAVDCRVWPLNKQMVKVADIHATDPSGIVPGSFNITVTANEPLNSGDVVITNGVVQLRAFRQGNSGGRIYTIVARASSNAGGTTVLTGQCTVPHDSGHDYGR